LYYSSSNNDPDVFVEIEDEEPDAALIPVWLQLLEVEAAALLDESEETRCHTATSIRLKFTVLS
jgi:hypothetical protein